MSILEQNPVQLLYIEIRRTRNFSSETMRLADQIDSMHCRINQVVANAICVIKNQLETEMLVSVTSTVECYARKYQRRGEPPSERGSGPLKSERPPSVYLTAR